MVFDWMSTIHPINQMSFITESKEHLKHLEKELYLETQHLNRLEEELMHIRDKRKQAVEKIRKIQDDIEYENAKDYPNRQMHEAIARDRAIAKARGDDKKWGFTSPSSQRPWEIARDLKLAEQARVNSKNMW